MYTLMGGTLVHMPMQSYYCKAQLLSDFENDQFWKQKDRVREKEQLHIFAQMYNLPEKVITLGDHPVSSSQNMSSFLTLGWWAVGLAATR